MANFDLRFLGLPDLPNMLVAQPNLVPQNMLTAASAQPAQPAIDLTTTGATPSKEQIPKGGIMAAFEPPQGNLSAPVAVSQNDPNYYPPAPDANRAPVNNRPFVLPQQQSAPQVAQQPAQGQSSNSAGLDLGTVSAFLQGLGRGNGLLSAIGGGLGAVQERKQENQTMKYLTAQGFSAPEAQIISRSPQAVVQVMQNIRKGQDPKANLELQKLGYETEAARIKAMGGGAMEAKDRYMTVGKQVFDKTTGKLVDLGAGGLTPEGTEYGVTPVFGVDPEGQTVFAQLGKDGNVKVQKVDGFSPLSPGDKASDTAQGKARGEARANLPGIEQNATQMLGMIDALANDPYLDSMLGPVNSRKWNLTGDSERVQGRMNQIGGQTFLQAYNMLRGGGVITDIEGEKATEALARLNTAQNPEDYRAALTELRSIVQNGLDRSRRMADMGIGGPTQNNKQPSSTNIGGYVIEEAN